MLELDPNIRLYTMKAATEILGLTKNALYIARREGFLRTVIIAGRILVPADELNRLLTEGDGSDSGRGKVKERA